MIIIWRNCIFHAKLFCPSLDIFENNESIVSHGDGNFIEIMSNGMVVKCVVRRKRIKPVNGDLRSLFIENRNLHSLPILCRGVLVSATIDQMTHIACISCWCKDKFSLFFGRSVCYIGAYMDHFSRTFPWLRITSVDVSMKTKASLIRRK